MDYNIKKKNNKFGIVDKSGNWVVKPEYDWAIIVSLLESGKSLIGLTKNNKWGFFYDGKVITEPVYDDIILRRDKKHILVKMPDGKFGIVDLNNKFLIPPIFDDVYSSLGPDDDEDFIHGTISGKEFTVSIYRFNKKEFLKDFSLSRFW